jgi:uncharacterized protein (DUF302 family)
MGGSFGHDCGFRLVGIPFCLYLCITTTGKGRAIMGLFKQQAGCAARTGKKEHAVNLWGAWRTLPGVHPDLPLDKAATGRHTSKTLRGRGILLAFIFALQPLTGCTDEQTDKTVGPGGSADEHPVKTVRVSGDFKDIRDSVRQAIEGKGINIAHTLPAGDMLNRTGKDFGIAVNTFIQAETVEFCSARISHRLVQANPENILLCPFTISIYVLTTDPENVRLSYRRPFTLPDDNSQAAVQEVVQLIEGVISEATAW